MTVRQDTEWTVYLSHSVSAVFEKLKSDSARLLKKDPAKNVQHPKVRDFIKLQKAIRDAIANPHDPSYRLGHSLGERHKDWRRIKRDLPSRYRLFFRFFETSREIFFVWLNDAQHIRREGHRKDVYTDFARRLDSSNVPNQHDELLDQSIQCDPKDFDPDTFT